MWRISIQSAKTRLGAYCGSDHEFLIAKFRLKLKKVGKTAATHSSILAWRIPGAEEPSGLPSMGSHRVGHDWSDLAAAAGKTARPFMYDLNQIPYNYTVEVTNRFKGLDVIDRVPDELWMEVHDIV